MISGLLVAFGASVLLASLFTQFVLLSPAGVQTWRKTIAPGARALWKLFGVVVSVRMTPGLAGWMHAGLPMRCPSFAFFSRRPRSFRLTHSAPTPVPFCLMPTLQTPFLYLPISPPLLCAGTLIGGRNATQQIGGAGGIVTLSEYSSTPLPRAKAAQRLQRGIPRCSSNC